MNQQLFISLQGKINQSTSAISSMNKEITELSSKLKNISLETNLKIDETNITSLNTQLQNISNKLEPIKVKITADTSSLNNSISQSGSNGGLSTSFDSMASEIASASSGAKTLRNEFASVDDVLDKLGVTMKGFSLNSDIEKTNGSVKNYTNSLGQTLTITEKLRDGQSSFSGSLKSSRDMIYKNNKELGNQNLLLKDSKYSWAQAAESFVTYMSVTTVFYQASAAVRSMIDEILELDDALVELSKVTELTDSQMQTFLEDAYEGAARVAKTGTEMVQAATEFAKAGYSAEDAQVLGEVALMYTNIADEALGAAESSEFIIAQMKAFNIEADDAIHIIDAVNEVSNKYAVSSADIANNLGKSSAVMANAGNSYEEMIGLLTAGTEITRSASKVSNGLKTISLNLAGMDEEGNASLEVMASMEDLFSKLGLTLYDSNGELKNTFTLLEELAPVYRDAANDVKMYITETIAGKYQAQNLAAILNNFETAAGAAGTALESSGSAMTENAKAIESVEGHINQLKSSWEQLSTTLLNSDILKFFLDFATSLTNFASSGLGQFIIKMGVLWGILKTGTIIFNALNLGIYSWKKRTTETITAIGGMGNAFKSLTKIMQIARLEQEIGSMTLDKAKVSMTAMGISTKEVTNIKDAQIRVNQALSASTMALNAILGVASLAITAGISLYQKYKQAKEEAAQAALEEATALQEDNLALEDNIAKIKELDAVLKDIGSSYEESASAREELQSIQDSLIDQYGLEKDEIDLVTGSIDEQIKKLRELQKEQAKDYLTENKSAYEDAKKNLEKESGTYSKYDSENQTNFLEELTENFDMKGLSNANMFSYGFNAIGEKEEIIEYWENVAEEINNGREKIKKEYDLTDKQIEEILVSASDNINYLQEKLGDSRAIVDNYNTEELNAAGFQEFEDKLMSLADSEGLNTDNVSKLIEEYDGLDDVLKTSGSSIDDLIRDYQNMETAIDGMLSQDYGEGFTDSLKELVYSGGATEEAIEELKDVFPDFEDALDDAGIKAEDFANYLKDLEATAQDFNDSVGDFASGAQESYDAIGTLTSAVDEFNENGSFSTETLSTLADTMITLADGTSASLLSFMSFTNDGVYANTAALQGNIDALRQAAIATIQESAAQQILQLTTEETEVSVGMTGTAITNFASKLDASIASDTAKIASNMKVGMSYDYLKAKAEGEDVDTSKWDENREEIDSIIAGASNAMSALMSTGNDVSTAFSNATGGGSSSSSSEDTTPWWETELERLKEQFDFNEMTIEEYINSVSNLLGQLQHGSDEWREVNDLLQGLKMDKLEDDYDRGLISLEAYIAGLKDLQNQYKANTEAWNELADSIKEALQEQADLQKDDYETAHDAAIGIIDKEIEKLEELRDAEEERYDALIEAKEKANEETERELELARLQEALANAQNEKTKRVWKEGLGKKSAQYKDNYIGQMLEIVQTEVRLNLRLRGELLWQK